MSPGILRWPLELRDCVGLYAPSPWKFSDDLIVISGDRGDLWVDFFQRGFYTGKNGLMPPMLHRNRDYFQTRIFIFLGEFR